MHVFQPVDLQQIAQELSPVRLTQKFKASFGMPPNQYLTSLRLEAGTLLLEKDLTLEQIAECVGCRNGYYLTVYLKNSCRLHHPNIENCIKYKKKGVMNESVCGKSMRGSLVKKKFFCLCCKELLCRGAAVMRGRRAACPFFKVESFLFLLCL